MTAVSQSSHPARVLGLRRRVRVPVWRRVTGETWLGLALVMFFTSVGVLVSQFPEHIPFTTLSLPVVVASITLGPRILPWFVIYDMSVLTFCLTQQVEITGRTIGAVAVQFMIALVVLLSSFRRSSLGVAGLRGDSMFVDLRDRILNQGGIPRLPEGWLVESALHSAGGTAFAGDFVVATQSADGQVLQLVVVDVSGKGEEAGTRALLLSGAFGGLLNALPPQSFLPAANDYLLRQDWAEGFATAVHLTVDVSDGTFAVRTAGHPPAAHRIAGTGRWAVLRSDGPVLGLIEYAEFGVVRGRLAHGDAVLLYTDGMVEEPRIDIDLGIDRMLGEAESMIHGSFEGAAERLATSLGSRDDDRAMLVVHRA